MDSNDPRSAGGGFIGFGLFLFGLDMSGPLMVPVLVAGVVIVFSLLIYAGFLLYKEFKAVREIAAYLDHTLSSGFPLSRVVESLRQAGWTQAHIEKSMHRVLKMYVSMRKKTGKSVLAMREEFILKGWPTEILGKVLPPKK